MNRVHSLETISDILSAKSKCQSPCNHSMLQTICFTHGTAKEGYPGTFDVNQHLKNYFYFGVSNHHKKQHHIFVCFAWILNLVRQQIARIQFEEFDTNDPLKYLLLTTICIFSIP
jgi:hypothetical protein